MPFVEENDLVNLHKDVEKAQKDNEKLLKQIKHKSKDLRTVKIQRNVLLGITLLVVLGILAVFWFKIAPGDKNSLGGETTALMPTDSLEVLTTRIHTLRVQNEELAHIKDFYLAKALLQKEKIYTVQVMAFADTKTALVSEGLTNTQFVKNNPFYSYSLGNFETLGEARVFRKQLVAMGFDDAFIASYQNGKRIKIEEPY